MAKVLAGLLDEIRDKFARYLPEEMLRQIDAGLAVERLGAPGAASQWRPIDSAPKDGTRILLSRKGFAERACVGWWDASTDEWVPVQGVLFSEATHWARIHLPE